MRTTVIIKYVNCGISFFEVDEAGATGITGTLKLGEKSDALVEVAVYIIPVVPVLVRPPNEKGHVRSL